MSVFVNLKPDYMPDYFKPKDMLHEKEAGEERIAFERCFDCGRSGGKTPAFSSLHEIIL